MFAIIMVSTNFLWLVDDDGCCAALARPRSCAVLLPAGAVPAVVACAKEIALLASVITTVVTATRRNGCLIIPPRPSQRADVQFSNRRRFGPANLNVRGGVQGMS